MNDVVKKSIYDRHMREWEESDEKRAENKRNRRYPAKHYDVGTVENRRQQKMLKQRREERPDSIEHVFSGYIHDKENFRDRKWSEEALLKEDGYTESVWLENFPD